jgi:beta-lactamase superfamily II metal-dependent hydrolase
MPVKRTSNEAKSYKGFWPATQTGENVSRRSLCARIHARSADASAADASDARVRRQARLDHRHASQRGWLWQPDYQPADQPKNDDSLVFEIAYGERSVLFTGDRKPRGSGYGRERNLKTRHRPKSWPSWQQNVQHRRVPERSRSSPSFQMAI